ncbi:uncharacterized protein MELLADRAFT_115192 [Melampsora larici-populina 98AG31]|uniref:Pantothenate kinase n=1 Tax=Melampsora larici-populina (strain 98AG31 / pathotype 3-4-7) TaxID=747676 RepID=F4R7J3_MELLP|nr:uncharacterized protein MELLADRAFT_115192 [Melampsora larici-populina 98AG31]EGG11776.1 hypothetical protein MELLADRAFT_115192 [Melampsora larici-populina 98AG31]
MQNRHLPTPTSTLKVDISGAEILDDHHQSVETSDIYLPKHTEYISHIALDIGGSLAKIVYFTRATTHQASNRTRGTTSVPSTGSLSADNRSSSQSSKGAGLDDTPPNEPQNHTNRNNLPTSKSTSTQPNGILTPKVVRNGTLNSTGSLHGEACEHQDSCIRDQHELPTPTTSSLSSVQATSQAVSLAAKSDSNPIARQSFSGPSRHTQRLSGSSIPGGRLNFTKFETEAIETECIPFIANLIEISAASNGVPISTMKRGVKIILTGGGAHIYSEMIKNVLGGDVEVLKEEEMDCLITGLNFITEIPNEVFWFSDELVQHIVQNNPHDASEREDALETSSRLIDAINETSSESVFSSKEKSQDPQELPRPSPNPPQYSVLFDSNPTPQFPCMLVNIGSGVSIIKVSAFGKFERISGTSLGGGTLWGLLSLLTQAKSFDEMLDLSMMGDNSKVDMLVGDIYGQDYQKIGLKSSTIASSFGKVFKKRNKNSETDESKDGSSTKKDTFRAEDISKSLLYAISNNIGQIAHLNAEKHGLDRIYFGGCFIRGHAATVSTLSYAIRFWSKGTKRAFFLRHEGYLGSIGAWLKNLDEEEPR